MGPKLQISFDDVIVTSLNNVIINMLIKFCVLHLSPEFSSSLFLIMVSWLNSKNLETVKTS